jgi:hypothetical protein
VHIVTAAPAGGIRVHGEEFAYLVRDVQGLVSDIAVSTASGLRTLVPALHPAAITFLRSDAERPAMSALVESLRQGGPLQ